MEIRKVETHNLHEVLKVYKSCVSQHRKSGFNQWDDGYPSKATVERDIAKGWLFGGFLEGKLTSLISITKDEPKEYRSIEWSVSSNYFVIHRLGVHKSYLRKGFAKKLMDFAEEYAKSKGCLAIKLDTFTLNKAALNFYNKIGYSKTGYVNFPKRTDSNYTCFEKLL